MGKLKKITPRQLTEQHLGIIDELVTAQKAILLRQILNPDEFSKKKKNKKVTSSILPAKIEKKAIEVLKISLDELLFKLETNTPEGWIANQQKNIIKAVDVDIHQFIPSPFIPHSSTIMGIEKKIRALKLELKNYQNSVSSKLARNPKSVKDLKRFHAISFQLKVKIPFYESLLNQPELVKARKDMDAARKNLVLAPDFFDGLDTKKNKHSIKQLTHDQKVLLCYYILVLAKLLKTDVSNSKYGIFLEAITGIKAENIRKRWANVLTKKKKARLRDIEAVRPVCELIDAELLVDMMLRDLEGA